MSWLLWITLQWTWEPRYLFKTVILSFSDKYPIVGLLHDTVALFLTSRGACTRRLPGRTGRGSRAAGPSAWEPPWLGPAAELATPPCGLLRSAVRAAGRPEQVTGSPGSCPPSLRSQRCPAEWGEGEGDLHSARKGRGSWALTLSFPARGAVSANSLGAPVAAEDAGLGMGWYRQCAALFLPFLWKIILRVFFAPICCWYFLNELQRFPGAVWVCG